MIKFTFGIPQWLHWLVPNRAKDEQRAALTGSASRSYLFGIVTITVKEQT